MPNMPIATSQKCMELGGNAACARQIAIAELGRGNEEAALAATRFAEQLTTGGINTLAALAYLYGRLGQADEAQRVIQELSEAAESRHIEPLRWADVYIGIGDYDTAFNIVSENIDRRAAYGSTWIEKNVFDDPALEEPRWVELRNRMRPR